VVISRRSCPGLAYSQLLTEGARNAPAERALERGRKCFGSLFTDHGRRVAAAVAAEADVVLRR
jgi:hypothetical protein